MASPKAIEKKKKIVEEISENVKNAQTVVFFDYKGLSVSDMTELRRKLKENDSDLKVYKNTLTTRALTKLEIDLDEHLVGPKAMAFGNDVIAPIKILSDFSKSNKKLQMQVGIVEGNITSLDVLNKLAMLPTREVLLTQIAAGLLGAVKNLSICLDLYSKSLE